MIFNLFICIVFTLALCSCGKKNSDEIISIGGSTTATSIMDEIISSYKKIKPNMKITYDAQGSSVGINGIFDGIYKIALSSRVLSEEESAKGAKAIEFAHDTLIFLVSKDVNITNLTEEDLGKILNGTITNWKKLGGIDSKINFINRDSSSGTYVAIKKLILEKIFIKSVMNEYKKDGIIVKSNGETIEKLSLTQSSIGYIGMGYIKNALEKELVPISINGVYPTKENILKEKYKIKRPLLLVTHKTYKNKNVKDLINYIMNEEGQAIIEEQGFIAIR